MWQTSNFNWLLWKYFGNIRFPLITMNTGGKHVISIDCHENMCEHRLSIDCQETCGKHQISIECHENKWPTSNFQRHISVDCHETWWKHHISIHCNEKSGKHHISIDWHENTCETSNFHCLPWKLVWNIDFQLIARKTCRKHQISIDLNKKNWKKTI